MQKKDPTFALGIGCRGFGALGVRNVRLFHRIFDPAVAIFAGAMVLMFGTLLFFGARR